MKKLLLFSLFFFSVFSIRPNYAQPILKIIGAKDSVFAKNHLDQLIQLLDIYETVHISVIFTAGLPKNTQGMTIEFNSPKPEDYKIVKVWIYKHLTNVRHKLVLAHEMIHVKQYVKGELSVVDEHHLNWKGHIYAYMRKKDYKYSPWEHEAYTKDNVLAQQCNERPATPLYAVKARP